MKKRSLCRDPGSNRGPSDLQSDALPTELSRLVRFERRACFYHLSCNIEGETHTKTTARGFEPLRAEPNGFRVHLLNRSDTLSWARSSKLPLQSGFKSYVFPPVRGQERSLTTPGVEPGLSRPQRDVLTTRRCGLCSRPKIGCEFLEST